MWNLLPQDWRRAHHKYNPLLSSPASSAISAPFKTPPCVFLPPHCPLASHLFHLTPDGALSWIAVGSLRSLVFRACQRCIPSYCACWDFTSFQKIRDYSPKHLQVLCYRGWVSDRLTNLHSVHFWENGPVVLSDLTSAIVLALAWKGDWVGWTFYGIWIYWKEFTFHGETHWIRWCPCRNG